MNSLTDDDAFLSHWQSLYFSLCDGDNGELDPFSLADVYRSLMNQVKVAKLTNRLSAAAADALYAEYLQEYGDLIDNDKGISNYSEAVLALSANNRNERAQWKTSLSEEAVLQMFAARTKSDGVNSGPSDVDVQNFIDAFNKTSIERKAEEKLFPNTLKTEQNFSLANHIASSSRPSFSENSSLKGQHYYCDAIVSSDERNCSEDSIDCQKLNVHGFRRNQDSQAQKFSLRINKEHDWNIKKQQGKFGSIYENANSSIFRECSKRKIDDEEPGCSNENQNVRAGSSFCTAKDQLIIDQHKKYSRSSSGSGSVQSTDYGSYRKCLGTRRGPSSRFNPPVMNKNLGESDDGLQMMKNRSSKNLSINGAEDPLKNIDSKMVELMQNEIMDHGPPITWDDIAGLEFAKSTIQEIVVWPLLRPDIFTGLRGPPKGILLFGPPGTGKTLIGKCIASQSKSTFFCISASSLTSKWVGEGEKMVRALFAVARCYQPAVIFIDEIDSLLTQRSDTEHESTRRIKTEFLVQLDGAATASDERLLIVGATNRPQELDEAARRRLVKRLYIALPDSSARKHIVKKLLMSHSNNLSDEDLDIISQKTDEYSGADMANLCKEAALGPIRSLDFTSIEFISPDQVRPINLKDFLEALKQVRASVSGRDLDIYVEWNKKYGSSS